MGPITLSFTWAMHASPAYFYRLAFGMKLVAYAGPETGVRDRASYVLEQGKVRFVLTTPLRPDGEIAEHVRVHGDGVRDVALWVDDARQAWKETTKRGARSVREPFELKDEQGMVRISSIAAYGDTIHSFVERSELQRAVFAGISRGCRKIRWRGPSGLIHVDHMVGNVGWNEMNRWVDFYAQIMGFSLYQHFDDKDISTEYSALMSKVMANGNGRVKFPINEPAEGRRKSQIEEYLEFYHGPGVQHIALATNDILRDGGEAAGAGCGVPDRAAHVLHRAGGPRGEDRRAASTELEKLGVLVDRDDEGYMLQIFTKPVEDRPTLFFEIIQRKGSRSFGKGNFKALFEAIEREQAARGNL